jgi:hypothetical protein
MTDTSWPDVGFPREEVDMVRVRRDGSRWAFHGRTDEEWIAGDRSAFVELPQ